MWIKPQDLQCEWALDSFKIKYSKRIHFYSTENCSVEQGRQTWGPRTKTGPLGGSIWAAWLKILKIKITQTLHVKDLKYYISLNIKIVSPCMKTEGKTAWTYCYRQVIIIIIIVPVQPTWLLIRLDVAPEPNWVWIKPDLRMFFTGANLRLWMISSVCAADVFGNPSNQTDLGTKLRSWLMWKLLRDQRLGAESLLNWEEKKKKEVWSHSWNITWHTNVRTYVDDDGFTLGSGVCYISLCGAAE